MYPTKKVMGASLAGLAMLGMTMATVGAAPSAAAPKDGPSNGTTLAGYKTIDICEVDAATWRYSGEIAVWNQGAIDTVGLTISDFIENKPGNKWQKAYDVPVTYSGEIPAGTTQETALTFPYSYEGAPLTGTIRNSAKITITNHSGALGKDFGPNPKATYTGTVPPPACDQDLGFVYTQGYWGSKPGVVWPDPYSRDASFYLSEKTWQQVMDTPVNESQGYYQLAHQYIAAVLNQANGAYVPPGVQETLNLAEVWLAANGPSACTANGSCGTQKTWAGVLDDYNNGDYPGGPPHGE
jgi:hypothetical protein